MEANKIVPGAEGLVQHVSTRLHSRGPTYRAVRVTRVTKARVFVKGDHETAREVEFRLDNLTEYGKKPWDADRLILDPAKIAEAEAEMAARRARDELEARARKAMTTLKNLFDGYALVRRSEAEIQLLEELASRLQAGSP